MHGGYYFSLLEEMQRGEPSEIRETQFRSCNCPGTTLKHQDFVPLLLGPPFKGLVDPSLPSADYSFRLVLFRHWRSCCFHIRLDITLLSGNRIPNARTSLIISRSSISNCLGER